jgi:hypothetical protein
MLTRSKVIAAHLVLLVVFGLTIFSSCRSMMVEASTPNTFVVRATQSSLVDVVTPSVTADPNAPAYPAPYPAPYETAISFLPVITPTPTPVTRQDTPTKCNTLNGLDRIVCNFIRGA